MAEFARSLPLKLDRQPLHGTFELTICCNLQCAMCLFRHDPSENADIQKQERTAEEWLDIARQAAAAGTYDLTITGGEPLLRKDFPIIWRGLNKIGFMLELFTNATLVTPEIMELFAEYPPHRIGVTIYGATEETYRKVSGNGKAFDDMVRGVKLLTTLPSALSYRTTLIKDNVEDLPQMEALVRNEFGSDTRLIHSNMVFKPVRGGCSSAEACRLSPKENVDLMFKRSLRVLAGLAKQEGRTIKEVRIQEKDKSESLSGMGRHQKQKLTIYGCDAGMKSYTISWDGKLMGCQIIQGHHTYPLLTGFSQAWEDYPKVALPDRPAQLPANCLQCEVKKYCNSCYAAFQAENVNENGFPEYLCQNAQEMARKVRMKEVFVNEENVQ